MRLFGKQLRCSCLRRLTLYFVCGRSLLNPVWTEMKQLQEKLRWSNLVRLSSSSSRLTVWLTDTLLPAKASQSMVTQSASPVGKKHSVDQPIRTERRESHWLFIFRWNPRPGGKENIIVKTGLIRDQFSSKWCHFSTPITLFNQVIHHNDKVKPSKLSSFTLS